MKPHLTPDEHRVRRSHLAVTAGALLLCALAYLAVALVAAPELPDPVAVHFGLDGRPDGWMSTATAVVVFGVFAVGLPGLMLVVLVGGQWWRGASARMTSGFIGGLAAGLVTLFGWLLLSQRGVVDSTRSQLDWWAIVAAAVVGLAVGLAMMAMLPPNLPQPDPVDAVPTVIAPSDRVSWFGSASPSGWLSAILGGTALLMVVLALAVGEWWMWLLAVLTILLVPMTSMFRVTIDRRGLSWRSPVGWPRGRVSLEEVVSAAVVQVRPGDFGGYGLRTAPGATGLITRSGQALSVTHRRPGKQERALVITVDDAMTAASVLEGLRLSRTSH